jgi:diadenosine tetraphosphate (Ap4A) HIT family hydrolase
VSASPFLDLPRDRIIAEDELVIALWDAFPVSPGHALVVPRRVVPRLADLTGEERDALWLWVNAIRSRLAHELSPAPDGFNLGLNDGEAAGQTVMHLHFHVIPRYRGDVDDPRGGVRWVVPGKARYWER